MALSGPWVLCAAETRADSELPSFSAPLAQPRFTVCPSCQAQQEQVGGLSGLKHRDGVSGAKQPKKQPQTSGSEVRTQVRQVMVVVGG